MTITATAKIVTPLQNGTYDKRHITQSYTCNPSTRQGNGSANTRNEPLYKKVLRFAIPKDMQYSCHSFKEPIYKIISMN